jgi:hypothetical protein
MKLADRVAQTRVPLDGAGSQHRGARVLNNTADCAEEVARCPLRFVLSDDLTRLCTALAYSVGSSTLECADLLRVPATLLWLEWNRTPWESELARYGFASDQTDVGRGGRRGALLRASPDGRRGTVRTFWSNDDKRKHSRAALRRISTSTYRLARNPNRRMASKPRLFTWSTMLIEGEDVLSRCFRFRYERSWREYYDRATLSTAERDAA